MKRITVFILSIILSLGLSGNLFAQGQIIGPLGSGGGGKVTDTNCDQAKYYALTGPLCQSSVTGKLYKPTGTGILEVAAGASTGDVVGPATNHDAYLPQWNGANSKTLKDGIPITANMISLLASANYATARTNLGLAIGTDVLAPNGNGSSLTGLTASQLPDAAADGATKGVATFNANDFNASSGVITIDYTNGQAAATGAKGFLTAADWNTFNSKAAADQTMYIGTTQVAINRGSGALTLAGITLTTPNIGVATATSVNRMAITAPATGSTLAVADGKVFTVSNTLTLAGTDSSVITFPAASGTVAYAGTMTSGKICTSNADGKTVDCNTDTPTGLGTITAVGDITSGAGFTAGVPGKTLVWNNATSGTITLQAQTGALGTATISLGSVSGTPVVGPANVPVSIAGPTAARVITVNDNAFSLLVPAGKALNLAGSLITSGSYDATFTLTNTTGVTFPTSGTLATLAGSESLTNKKLGSLTSNGLVTTSGGDGTLSITVPASGILTWLATPSGANLASALTSAIPPAVGGTGVANGANNTITFTGNYTLGLTLSNNTALTLPTSGTLATLSGSESLTNKKLGSLTSNGFVKTSSGDGTLSVDTTSYGSISGTPANHYWGVWASASAVKGVSVTGSKVVCSDTNGEPTPCTNLTDLAFSSYLPLAGGTMTAGSTLITAATASGQAGLRLPHGTAPASPTNGDLWTTTAGLYARINGSTVGPFGTSTATIGGSLAATNYAIPMGNGTANTITTSQILTDSSGNLNIPTGATYQINGVTVMSAGSDGSYYVQFGNNTIYTPAAGYYRMLFVGGVPKLDISGTLYSIPYATNANNWTMATLGTSGGIPYFSASNTLSSSGALTQYGVLTGGGAGNGPVVLTVGTDNQVLLGHTGAAAAFGSLPSAALPTVPGSKGGTGIANNDLNTITFAGGNYSMTFTLGGNTNLTYPASGTVATVTAPIALASQAAGDQFYATSGTAIARIAKSGTAYTFWRQNSGLTAPEWSTATIDDSTTNVTKLANGTSSLQIKAGQALNFTGTILDGGLLTYTASGSVISTTATGFGANNIVKLSATPGTPDGTKVLRDDGTWVAQGAFVGGTLTSALTLRAGAVGAGAAPAYFQAGGALLTTPVAGALEISNDANTLYYTIATGPARKTVAFTDSAITSSTYIGTTSVVLNRSSAALSLAGVSLDNAAAQFYDTSAPTKLVKIDPSNQTAGHTGIIQAPDNGTAILSNGTMAITGGKLSQFAATSSTEFFGVISDETGSGAVVGGTSPAFTTDIHAATVGGATVGTSVLPMGSIYFAGQTGPYSINLTGTPTANRTVTYPDQSGTVTLAVTTSDLTADKVYYRSSTSAWTLADATTPVRGHCFSATTTSCVTKGVVTWTSHGFAAGDLYLTTSGGVTSTAPSSTGNIVQKIGWVFDANTIVVNISPDYGTVQ